MASTVKNYTKIWEVWYTTYCHFLHVKALTQPHNKNFDPLHVKALKPAHSNNFDPLLNKF